GEPLHPRADDPLPWHLLDELDAVYFTAQDPALLVRARRARVLVGAARRRECIAAAGIELDAIVGSRADPRERAERADYAVPPAAESATTLEVELVRLSHMVPAGGTDGFSAPALHAPFVRAPDRPRAGVLVEHVHQGTADRVHQGPRRCDRQLRPHHEHDDQR